MIPSTVKTSGMKGKRIKNRIIIIPNIIPQIISTTLNINLIVLIIPRNIVNAVYIMDIITAFNLPAAIFIYCIIRLNSNIEELNLWKKV